MMLLLDALTWLADPARWVGDGSVPVRAGEHLLVTAVAMLVAAAVALPVGVAVGHTRRGRLVVVALAGAARAVPTLGLLTLLALALGIGVGAPLVALVVLAVPSLLAGTAAGVRGVDPVAVDAARASGFTEGQVVVRVELPLAAPVVVGAVRAATLQVIATATLVAYVADVGLGRYVMGGLKSRDYPQMLAGALVVIVLALAVDGLVAGIHRAATSRRRSPGRRRAQRPATPREEP
nr:ABC transporter permease subunit [Cellulomonas sp. SLBN-39]